MVGPGGVPPQAVLSSVRIRFPFGIQFKLFGKIRKHIHLSIEDKTFYQNGSESWSILNKKIKNIVNFVKKVFFFWTNTLYPEKRYYLTC